MAAWAVRGVELPFGSQARSWWIDAAGAAHDEPADGAEALPGSYILPGLVDAHAHPAITGGKSGPQALTRDAARANLLAWGQAGVTLVRDAGSPGGLTLDLDREPGMPAIEAAGRFLAPADRYFPELLVTPVAEAELVSAALSEIGRGATWVKLVADFPDLAAGTAGGSGGRPPASTAGGSGGRPPASTAPEPTYALDAIAALTDAVHEAGGRVAAHSTTSFAGQLVTAGVDSIEHGTGLDEDAVKEMASRGVAWTPTLGATFASMEAHLPADMRHKIGEMRDRLAFLLPLAVRLGVPVLAGTDATGTLPGEVAVLASFGLSPSEALAAASAWPRQYIGGGARADIVTYHHDPRDDPDQLTRPAAVVVGGTRLR
jgi:imidazolonepropionase-like amidohydrolase